MSLTIKRSRLHAAREFWLHAGGIEEAKRQTLLHWFRGMVFRCGSPQGPDDSR
jgi:hypothetical protein